MVPQDPRASFGVKLAPFTTLLITGVGPPVPVDAVPVPVIGNTEDPSDGSLLVTVSVAFLTPVDVGVN